MNLTKEERAFVKNNRKMLASIFTKRIEELKLKVFDDRNLGKEDLQVSIDFINELRSWLKLLQILDQKPKKEETFT